MQIRIRNSNLQDFADVMLLFKQLWPGKVLNEHDMMIVYSRSLQADSDECLCVEFDGKIIGFCSFAIINNFWQQGYIAYVYAMIIDDSFRGKGIGTELLRKVFEKARLRGCKKIELDSGFQRERAHKFYEKIGFEKRAFLFSKDLQ